MDASRDALNFVGGISDRFMTRIPSALLTRNPLPRAHYLERLRFYAEWPRDAEFYPIPEDPPALREIERQSIAGGVRLLYRYPSRFQGHNPAMRESLASERANQDGYLHLWQHGSGPGDSGQRRPLVLCIHGFGMSGPARAEQMFKISRMFERGMDVALHHLPHHWRRSDTPARSAFLRPQDLPTTIEEWVRNVHDLHSAVLSLRAQGYARIGAIGASLGGLTAELYATTAAAHVDFLFMVVPAVNLGTFLEPREARMAFESDAELRALSRQALERIVPTGRALRFDPDHIGVVAHQGDRICPITYTRELVQRWQLSHYTEVVGGHWIYLDRKVRGRTWYAWLQRHGYLVP